MQATAEATREYPAVSVLSVIRERRLVRLLRAFVLSGLFFMLLPGTFLGVWNLVSISIHNGAGTLSPSWIQAHGHAQIFGWLGCFILGIGFYSLPQGRRVLLRNAWICWGLWTLGVALRWITSVYGYQWRILLPASAAMEVLAFLIFYSAVSRHKASEVSGSGPPTLPAWIHAVVLGTACFGIALIANLGITVFLAMRGVGRAVPPAFDQPWLVLVVWGFLAPTVFGFTARWVPIFVRTAQPRERALRESLVLVVAGIIAASIGWMMISSIILAAAAVLAVISLGIFTRSVGEPKVRGVHGSMPIFIRLAYVWLLVSAALALPAAAFDLHNGYWGASRHALTVGFFAAMVFSIGPRVLPHFSGVKQLFSPRLMFWSLLLLNLGCALRVFSEPFAYEHGLRWAWSVLPGSAVTEMAAITLFALNILLTILFSPRAFAN